MGEVGQAAATSLLACGEGTRPRIAMAHIVLRESFLFMIAAFRGSAPPFIAVRIRRRHRELRSWPPALPVPLEKVQSERPGTPWETGTGQARGDQMPTRKEAAEVLLIGVYSREARGDRVVDVGRPEPGPVERGLT